MQLGDWQLDTINGGRFQLDGGVMFGVVPKTLWQGIAKPDEKNRVEVANHCVLARNSEHTILIDTGYGGNYPPLDRRFYGMEEGEPLLQSLAALGIPISTKLHHIHEQWNAHQWCLHEHSNSARTMG